MPYNARTVSGLGLPSPTKTKVYNYAQKELELFHPRIGLAQAVLHFIPQGNLGYLRAMLYRWAGFVRIGEKVYIRGALDLRGGGDIQHRLIIGSHTTVNTPCLLDLSGMIIIGERVGIGHNTTFITSNQCARAPMRAQRPFEVCTFGCG